MRGLCYARGPLFTTMEDSLGSPSRAPSPGFVTNLLDRSIGKLWNERPAADAPIAEYQAWGQTYCTAVVRWRYRDLRATY